MHRELRRSDIQHRDAEAGGQDGPDGGPTGAVVTDHYILQEEGPNCEQTFNNFIFFPLFLYVCFSFLSSNSFMLELLVYLLGFFSVFLIRFLFTSVVENVESFVWIHK